MQHLSLSQVPIGSFVYSMNETKKLRVHQRVSPDYWAFLRLDGTNDAVNLPEVLSCFGVTPGELVEYEPHTYRGNAMLLPYGAPWRRSLR